jgi:hypothetical protein
MPLRHIEYISKRATRHTCRDLILIRYSHQLKSLYTSLSNAGTQDAIELDAEVVTSSYKSNLLANAVLVAHAIYISTHVPILIQSLI